MKDQHYRNVNIECIDPVCFPDVALFIKSGGNYVLYKPQERKFTEVDRQRLQRNNTDILYVRSGDIDALTEYMEENLTSTMARDDIGSYSKGKILYQTSVNYVIELFETPDKLADIARCENLTRQLIQFVTMEKNALSSLKSIIENNYYVFVHSVQVTALTLLMNAELYMLDRDELLDVGVGALLHDLGMTFISNEIFDKPDALSDMEYYAVKRHAEKGYDFLKQKGGFSETSLSIVHHHHEKFDGYGYPSMLKGNAIPRSVQVTTLCDVYCALTTDRVYRKATAPKEALRMMKEESPGSYNEELLQRFVEVMGTIVREKDQ